MPDFSVRCLIEHHEGVYEERIVQCEAESLDGAIKMAMTVSASYADVLGSKVLDFAQAYGPLVEASDVGKEVFSLVRESPLSPSEYISSFFSTGTELES